MNAVKVCAIEDRIAQESRANIHAVIVVRNGRIVFEAYRDGADQRWGTTLGVAVHDPETLHDTRSITKSVVSLVFGIVYDRQLVGNVTEPFNSYFPELESLATEGVERISLLDLLTMRSGLVWNEGVPYSDPANSEHQLIAASEPYRFILTRSMKATPGLEWNYCGGCVQLIAEVVQRVTRESLPEFTRKNLFEPLGITHFEWLHMARSGEVAAASGLRLRPRDTAKLGQLILDRGAWRGKQIVSEDWIARSTSPHVAGFDQYPSIGYGYYWWTDYGNDISGRRVSWISAQGLGGQRLYVLPTHRTVVVINAGRYGESDDGAISFDIFEKNVLGAIYR
ncbi:MAG: serine hydrolase domain-containing protein [Aestuariivirga sp.]